MESKPLYNFNDVLKAPAAALSAKQILVMTFWLLISMTVYDLFTYLSFVINGESCERLFALYGFFPFKLMQFESLWSTLTYSIGIALAALSLMLGFFGVAAMNIESARGNPFLSAWQAIGFALKRFPQIFLAELSISLFVLLIVGLFALLGLVSRIPYIGEIAYTIIFAIPNFIIALFAVFVIFVFTLTIFLLPAVAAADRKGETFTAILETFSIIILRPFKWAGYTLYSLVAAKVCGFIYAYFAFRAVQFLGWSSSLGGGEQITRLIRSGLTHLPVRSETVQEIFNILPGVDFGLTVWSEAGYPSKGFLSYLMAFMLFIIFVSILGYMGAIIASAQASGYMALRCLKDGYKISDEDSLFFKEEPVNERVDETIPDQKS